MSSGSCGRRRPACRRTRFTDGLGSTLRTVNGSNGTTASTYRYDVFGELRSPPAGMPKDTMLFTGEQYDAKARGPGPNGGLYYLRARYYDPGIGRFLTQDPLPMGNLYAYSFNNPTYWTDPSGSLPGIGTVVGAVTGAVVGGGSTLAVDLLEDGKLNKSWKEYALNTGRGAALGAVCVSLGGVPCVIAAATSSYAGDALLGRSPDPCQAALEGISAGVFYGLGTKATSAVEAVWRGPFGPRNVKRFGTYLTGSRARHAYGGAAVSLPFDILEEIPGCGSKTAYASAGDGSNKE